MKKIPYVFEKPHKLSAKTNTSTEKRAESREEEKKRSWNEKKYTLKRALTESDEDEKRNVKKEREKKNKRQN